MAPVGVKKPAYAGYFSAPAQSFLIINLNAKHCNRKLGEIAKHELHEVQRVVPEGIETFVNKDSSLLPQAR